MKRITAILICLLLVISLLPALPSCADKTDDGKIRILCTLFPQYDWIKNIVGNSDSISVELLIKNGTDPHSYQPTAADIMEISNCDMIIYLGATSDVWVQEALKRANNESTERLALAELNGITLHNVSSSSHSHEEDGHDHHDDHDGHNHGALDEHLWLSLSNATIAIEQIADRLALLDTENAESYLANAAAYTAALGELDAKYKAAVESSPADNRFMLFADRFPFVYLLSDYGIEYKAAFEGCTTDVDADFDTVLGLIKEAEEHSVRYVAITETADGALARTVAQSAKGNIEIIVMNSLQSVTQKQLKDGISYLRVMEDNLTALKTAIGATGE